MLIKLSKGLVVKVDEIDFMFCNQYNWSAKSNGGNKIYAIRSSRLCEKGPRKHKYMHREILINRGIDLEGLEVDHVNGNSLDNTFSNLRIVNKAQNQWNVPNSTRNTSGRKGVNWDAFSGKWLARITVQGKQINLGRFPTFETACNARRQAESEFHGEFKHELL